MHDAARIEEDAPPESGVRPRVHVIAPPEGQRAGRDDSDAELLQEVAEEVFFEVLGVLRALAPVHAAGWLRPGWSHLAIVAIDVSAWPLEQAPRSRQLSRRWPELVPGAAAIDRLAHLMVDRLCAQAPRAYRAETRSTRSSTASPPRQVSGRS